MAAAAADGRARRRAAKLQFELEAYGDAPEHEPAFGEQYGRIFTQARAVEAVIAALDPDVEAVDDALYEANAALDHSPAVIWALSKLSQTA